MGRYQIRRLDRNRLYDEVWNDPVTIVSTRYGMSDVALAKYCRELGVPLPPRGYWSRLRVGQLVQRPALPDHLGPQVKEIRRWIGKKRAQPERLGDSEKGYGFTVVPNVIPVSACLQNPHPLVKKTEEVLRATRTNKYGVYFHRSGILSVRVSPALLERALRILNSMVISVEALGYTVAVGNGKSLIVVNGITIEFLLEEEVHREAHVPLPEELRKISNGEYVWIPCWDYRPSGNLILRITDVSCSAGIRKKFRDAFSKRVEAKLPDFIKAVLEAVKQKMVMGKGGNR